MLRSYKCKIIALIVLMTLIIGISQATSQAPATAMTSISDNHVEQYPVTQDYVTTETQSPMTQDYVTTETQSPMTQDNATTETVSESAENRFDNPENASATTSDYASTERGKTAPTISDDGAVTSEYATTEPVSESAETRYGEPAPVEPASASTPDYARTERGETAPMTSDSAGTEESKPNPGFNNYISILTMFLSYMYFKILRKRML